MRTVCLLLMACGLVFSQSADAPKDALKFYRLDFVVKDLDGGKVITARSYSAIVSTRAKTEIRAGSKVPVGGPTTYQMVDLGTNFDCSDLIEMPDEIAFHLTAEVASLMQENDPHPVIRQNRWASYVIVPLKKPTILFSSDDNTTKHVMQLEVTATPRS